MSNNRIAVVIGAASGIGWATAKALAAEGCTVTIADLNTDGAQARAKELGNQHHAVTVDVTDEASVQQLFEQTGHVDVVVNCAGFGGVGLITELPADQFRAVIDTCLVGAFLVIKHAGRHLGEGGALVSLTSLNARQPAVGMSAYCSAKAGLAMLTEVAALELGPRGIRVNAVSPGFVAHPAHRTRVECPRRPRGINVENTALGRAGTPEDIADAVAFLCSSKASWITGEVLDLNGGAHLMRYPNVIKHVMNLAGQ